jgi:ribose-phosphate pyrophosphokinase
VRSKASLKIFTGSSNPGLAGEIAAFIGPELGKCKLERFSDGEIHFYIEENVRGEDVYLIQSGVKDANFHMMELFLMIDACKRASAERITAVIPYYAYARQDWKDRPRVPISARLLADLLVASGADRVLTMDLHSPQIQGFFSIPVDNLEAAPVLVKYIASMNLERLTIVSPDVGGAGRARMFAKRLGAELAIVDKRRPAPNVAKVMHVIGDVKGRNVVILDDMVDTAGTLVRSAEALIRNGAKSVLAACTHPVLSGPAGDRIKESDLDKLIVTNTIPLSEKMAAVSKMKVLSVAELFGKAIQRINQGMSVSSLFD